MRIVPVPVHQDNYAYLLIDTVSGWYFPQPSIYDLHLSAFPVRANVDSSCVSISVGEAAAVDPAQVSPVLEAAKRENARITTILTTHHHW
jgi:glyoxylase-like metal-dependent hydrolase (beta-lactamase superfamily II)